MVPKTTELRYKAVQHTDKIGNQYLLEYSSETFEEMGETLWPLVGGVGKLASSYVVVAWVRLSDFCDTCGLTWLLFFFFSYPNFFPNTDNIYIILGLSRKNKNSREENNRDCS